VKKGTISICESVCATYAGVLLELAIPVGEIPQVARVRMMWASPPRLNVSWWTWGDSPPDSVGSPDEGEISLLAAPLYVDTIVRGFELKGVDDGA
jgi:hypothetical protein